MAKKKNYTADGTDGTNNAAAADLRSYLERVERLEEEKQVIADDIKEVFGEAKGRGYDVKAMKTILKIRKQDADERREQQSILETYLAALGMIEYPDDDLDEQYAKLAGTQGDSEEEI